MAAVAGVVAALAVAALAGLVRPAEPAPTGLVIITLDTTRADRLSPYGYMNVSLPAIERLAREGVVFDQASSVAPLTLPAHASLFTGAIPPRHGVRDNADPPLDVSHTTLAEVLASRGFRAAAFVASAVLAPDRGLAQGFETYDGASPTEPRTTDAAQRRADAVVDDAIAWLDAAGKSPFFLWTHLYDPHRPYDPPEPYRSTYGHNPYVGEIAFADAQIGRLVDALERLGRLDRTVVVVTADHGESLGDHGERDHGIFVYEEAVRVPLIVRAPGVPAGRVGQVVRLTDVMPTVLHLLGMPAPAMDGVSLAGLLRGDRRDLELEVYAESLYPERFGWSSLRALRSARFKLIDAPRPELYDLGRDPFEERNIYDLRSPLARAMLARLDDLAGRDDASGGTARADPPSDLRERLAALGYVAGPDRQGRAAQSRADLPDPKDCIGLVSEPGASVQDARCRTAPRLFGAR